MNYKEQLNRVISESGLTIKDIVKRCEELGEKVTTNYISVLKNQEGKIPSDNLSLAIAKACHAEYAEILVTQAYLDKAPDHLLKPLVYIHEQTLKVAEIDFKRHVYKMPKVQRIHEMKRLNEAIRRNDLASFICEFNAGVYGQFDITKIFEQTENPPEYKWALVRVQKESDIRFLDSDEVDDINII